MTLIETALHPDDAAQLVYAFSDKDQVKNIWKKPIVIGSCVIERKGDALLIVGSKDAVEYFLATLPRHSCG